MYKDDRKILLNQNHGERSPNTPNPETYHPKPRSILVDKQYTSEPSSPITDKYEKKVIMRNHSDLGSRIRKRVTYKLQSAPFKYVRSPQNYDGIDKGERKQLSHSNDFNTLYTIKSNSTENENETSNILHSSDKIEENQSIETYESTMDSGCVKIDCRTVEEERVEVMSDKVKLIEPTVFEPRQRLYGEADQLSIPDMSVPENSFCDPITPEMEKTQEDVIVDIDTCGHSQNINGKPYVSDCNSNAEESNKDHVVLMPLGSMQALAADSSDV